MEVVPAVAPALERYYIKDLACCFYRVTYEMLFNSQVHGEVAL